MTTFDSVSNKIRDCKENKVDAKADFKDTGAISVALFPRVGLLSPFIEIGHCLEGINNTGNSLSFAAIFLLLLRTCRMTPCTALHSAARSIVCVVCGALRTI